MRSSGSVMAAHSEQMVLSTPSWMEKKLNTRRLVSNEQMVCSVENHTLPCLSKVMLLISSDGRPSLLPKVSNIHLPLSLSLPRQWQSPPPLVPTHISPCGDFFRHTMSLLLMWYPSLVASYMLVISTFLFL